MPTYEYACKSCGEHIEVVQSFKDDPLAECPACGGPLRKVFGAIGIAFKGSGFYRTDSRPVPKEAASDAKSTSDAKSKGDGGKGQADKASGDAKPASEAKSSSDKPKADKQAAASS